MTEPIQLEHCAECGAGVLPGVDHDTYNTKDGEQWWCAAHCPQCAKAEVVD